MLKPNRTIRTPQSRNAYIKNICGIMRCSGLNAR